MRTGRRKGGYHAQSQTRKARSAKFCRCWINFGLPTAQVSMVQQHDVCVMLITSSLPLGLVACTEVLKDSNKLSAASARKFLHIVTGERCPTTAAHWQQLTGIGDCKWQFSCALLQQKLLLINPKHLRQCMFQLRSEATGLQWCHCRVNTHGNLLHTALLYADQQLQVKSTPVTVTQPCLHYTSPRCRLGLHADLATVQ
jgi:hypothetical protein